jgi:hypothetical protein
MKFCKKKRKWREETDRKTEKTIPQQINVVPNVVREPPWFSFSGHIAAQVTGETGSDERKVAI